MPSTDDLPYALYRAEQVRELDRLAIEEYGIAGQTLMERAGEAAFKKLRQLWPEARHITVITGLGNNAGDGFVVARLAKQAGLEVLVLQLGDENKLQGDALTNADVWKAMDGSWQAFESLPQKTDVIVDSILGTGLERDIEGRWKQAVEQINNHVAPVLALDVPSGLHSDTGRILGTCIKADATISFIGLKCGMFTGFGREVCGEIFFDALSVPARVYAHQILDSKRIDWHKNKGLIAKRSRVSHKGDFGHVLVVGGAPGFSGAARLAGEAALRTGAGLVSIATHPEHANTLNLGCFELMVKGVKTSDELQPLIERADAIVCGPGLGQETWGREMFSTVIGAGKPLLLDADGLNLLPELEQILNNTVITPHPGEAAHLLDCNIAQIQTDRFSSIEKLCQKFNATVVLKGSGSLIKSPGSQPTAVCSDGNPGMATAGMGDVLSGIIGALLGQGLELDDAACAGVALHAAAADRDVSKNGENGLIASDLYARIRELINE